jgi:rubrerythrin
MGLFSRLSHRPRDTASIDIRHVLFGGGLFDVTGDHPNRKGWDIFEHGQKSFWSVPTDIDWDGDFEESPEYSEAIAEMLAFLCPGEKAAVTGASLISTQVRSEEAKFYFVEQALEEAKHFDAMRRAIERIRGTPMGPPGKWIRLLYSFGVIDPDDVAFTMASINIIGEHLASQILHQITHVAESSELKKLLGLIAKDESRHVGAGKRFFPEVYPEYKRHRHEIMVKHFATTVILALAGADQVGPMRTLDIDLATIMNNMYDHYADVTEGLPPFPDQAVFQTVLEVVQKSTPGVIHAIGAMTDDYGDFDRKRFLSACAHAMRSPRALRQMFEV